MITYLAGILFPALLPSLVWTISSGLFLVLIACLSQCRKHAAYMLLGMLVASGYGAWQLHHRLDLPRLDLKVQGQIASLPVHRSDRVQFLLALDEVAPATPQALRLRTIRLSIHKPEVELKVGDRLVAQVRLRPPRGLFNPYGFDLERHYLAQGLDARGYVREIYTHHPAKGGLRTWRQSILDGLNRQYGTTSASTLAALVLGVRTGFSDTQWDVLRITGTAHLMVVSGLHIAVVAGFAWLLGRGVAVLCALVFGVQGYTRLIPMLIVIMVVTTYALLAGWGLPVQRAWVMLMVFVLGSWRLLQLTSWQRWRWSLVIVLSFQPLAVLEAGTWLSFVAVALIILTVQTGKRAASWQQVPGSWLRVQLALFACMLPMMVLYFQQFNPLAIGVNLLAVPLLTVVVWLLPLILPLAGVIPELRMVMERCISGYWELLSWTSKVPGLYLQTHAPDLGWVLLATLVLCIALLPLGRLYRIMAVVVLIPLIWAKPTRPAEDAFEAVVFDVGQGQAVLVRTGEGDVLYDTGPGYPGGGAAFDYALAPYFRARGIADVHTLVLSHDDLDHSGGYQDLVNLAKINTVLAGEPERRPGSAQCMDQSWELAGVSFRILSAYAGATNHLESNERSCVLSVRSQHCSLLLTGDLGVSGEYRLLSAGRVEAHNWMMAGHHGSRDSTSSDLLKQVAPERVLISAGFNNRFGHPHEQVLERLNRLRIPYLETAVSGAITLSANADGCFLSQHRETKKRYWTAG